MTKFILVGGYPTKAPDGGRTFAEEVVEGFDQPTRILDCIFARPEDSWQEALEKDRLFFAQQLRPQKVSIELAQKATFLEQLRKADTLNIRGGASEDVLFEFMKQGIDWKKELEGKTVAGSSAGADIMAKYYYGLDDLKVHEGLGLLPIKVMVHYGSDYNAPNIDWEKATEELRAYGEDHPILMLAEGQFEVMTN